MEIRPEELRKAEKSARFRQNDVMWWPAFDRFENTTGHLHMSYLRYSYAFLSFYIAHILSLRVRRCFAQRFFKTINIKYKKLFSTLPNSFYFSLRPKSIFKKKV